MTTVFIANATKQHLQFVYRLPEHKRPITQVIPYGQQKRLAQDMSQLDIDAIRAQYDKYGLIELHELEGRRHRFGGYMISFNKPIPEEKMKRAAKYREAVLTVTGHEFRKSSAAVMADTIARESGIKHDRYQITVAQVEPDQGFANGDDSHVAETYVVDNNNPVGPHNDLTPPGGRRGRRAA